MLIDTVTSPEMQVEPPPVDGWMTGLEKPSVLKAMGVTDVKPGRGLSKKAGGRQTEMFTMDAWQEGDDGLVKGRGRLEI